MTYQNNEVCSASTCQVIYSHTELLGRGGEAQETTVGLERGSKIGLEMTT